MTGGLEAVSCDIMHVLDDSINLVADIMQKGLTTFVNLFDLVISVYHLLKVEIVGLHQLL